MVFLKILPAVQPHRAHRHEVDIIGHYLRERMAIVTIPSIAKGLGDIANRNLVGFCLGPYGRRRSQVERKNRRDEDYQFHMRIEPL
jgi:hypothetical protein